jgi:hypothetical protein
MPPRPSNVIRVPKPPRSAFDKDRPASRLLLDQMIHLSAALIERLKNLNNRESSTPVTEAQAAELVRVTTNILHPHTAGHRAKKSHSTRGKKKGRARA